MKSFLQAICMSQYYFQLYVYGIIVDLWHYNSLCILAPAPAPLVTLADGGKFADVLPTQSSTRFTPYREQGAFAAEGLFGKRMELPENISRVLFWSMVE